MDLSTILQDKREAYIKVYLKYVLLLIFLAVRMEVDILDALKMIETLCPTDQVAHVYYDRKISRRIFLRSQYYRRSTILLPLKI